MTAPSNSAPRPLLIVVGLNAFQMMFSLYIEKVWIFSLYNLFIFKGIKIEHNKPMSLPDVGGYEERNSRTKTISFLQQLI